MTTLAVPRSRWTSAMAVYHAPVSNVLYDCHPRDKIQGYFSRDFLGLPRFRIVDSKPSVAAIFACSVLFRMGQREDVGKHFAVRGKD